MVAAGRPMAGYCLPVLVLQGSDLHAGGRNLADGRSANHRAVSSPLPYSPNLGCVIRVRKYKSCGASVDLAGLCMPVCGLGRPMPEIIGAAGVSSSGHRSSRRPSPSPHGDGHETDQDGHDAKSALDGHAVDFSDGSGRVRYGPSGMWRHCRPRHRWRVVPGPRSDR
jgi:hypothetical protein